jgi:putative oxidoreductase
LKPVPVASHNGGAPAQTESESRRNGGGENIKGDASMNGTAEPKLLFPGLAGFYASWREIAYALVRVVTGYILLMHGWGKLNNGLAGVTGYMTKQGLSPPEFFAGAAIFLETAGGICILIGLFTRFFSAALAIELAIAVLVVHLSKGFAVGQGGYEYALLMGIILFFMAIRGGGPYSVDRYIGKEL